MPVSESQVRPRSLSSGRTTQVTAARVKTAATRFSAALMGPRLASWSATMPALPSPLSRRKPRRVSHHQAATIMAMLIGRPTAIHWAKPMSMPRSSAR